MFAPSLNPDPHRGQSDGGGKTDWARDKVCHPELVSGSKLSAKHTSPYPLLLRRGKYSLYKSRLLKVFESFLSIFGRSTVTDYSLFTIHSSLILMQTLCLPNVSFAKKNDSFFTCRWKINREKRKKGKEFFSGYSYE